MGAGGRILKRLWYKRGAMERTLRPQERRHSANRAPSSWTVQGALENSCYLAEFTRKGVVSGGRCRAEWKERRIGSR